MYSFVKPEKLLHPVHMVGRRLTIVRIPSKLGWIEERSYCNGVKGAGVDLLAYSHDKLGELLIPVHDVVPAMVNDQVIVASNDEHIHGPGLLPIEV